jgi:hypothetical protein
MTQFTVAGTSKLPNGSTKVRYANDMTRVKVLVKGGHEDIDLIELPRAMTKEEIVSYLLSIDFADGNMDKAAAINAEAAKRKVELGEAKPAKAPKAKAVKATAEKAPAVTADLEDAPF